MLYDPEPNAWFDFAWLQSAAGPVQPVQPVQLTAAAHITKAHRSGERIGWAIGNSGFGNSGDQASAIGSCAYHCFPEVLEFPRSL